MLEDLCGFEASFYVVCHVCFCTEHPQFKKLPAQHGVYEVMMPFLFHIQTRRH